MPMFCRHNRLVANCPICRRELEAQLPQAPPKARARSAATRTAARGHSGRSTGLVTRRLARAADDGYRNPIVPGLKATADAARLADMLALAAARLEPPGPYPALAEQSDHEEATWLGFLLALAGPDAPELQAAVLEAHPSWASGEVPDLPGDKSETALAYRAWVERAGSQAAAFEGEPGWPPDRRFARAFERLSLPGFGRAARYELLVALGAAGVYDMRADALHPMEDDATILAAKRVLLSGDRMLLERRARELASACEVPIAALDRALALWGDGAGGDGEDAPAPVRRALGLT